MRCERTAKISDLFQSCKYFFQERCIFRFFTAYSRTSSSFIVNFQSFVRTVFFSNADAKVATFFEPANISASFFTKKLKKSEKQVRKGPHLIYKRAAAARYILLRQQQLAQATPPARKSAPRKTGRSAETFSMRGLEDSPADRRTSIYIQQRRLPPRSSGTRKDIGVCRSKIIIIGRQPFSLQSDIGIPQAANSAHLYRAAKCKVHLFLRTTCSIFVRQQLHAWSGADHGSHQCG